MRVRPAAAIIVILAFGALGLVSAQEPQSAFLALPETSRAELSLWLNRDCYEGLTQQDAVQLRTLDGALTPALAEIARRGPADSELADLREAYSVDFDARASTLARDGERLFGAEAAQRLAAVDREAYVQRRLEQASLNYRTNAVLALGLVGGDEASRFLNSLAANRGEALAESARIALSFMREDFSLPPSREQP